MSAQPLTCLVCGMSRSGTTLLATMLDSHPDIAMGYELMPVGVEDPNAAAHAIAESITRGVVESGALEEAFAAAGNAPLGRFVTMANRAGISPTELIEVLRGDPQLRGQRDALAWRVALSLAVVEAKRRKRGARLRGFKLNVPSIAAVDRLLSGARYIFIARDPRDVYASHIANDFGRSLDEVCQAWNGYVQRFLAFARDVPDRTLLVRYEDLVLAPDTELGRVARLLGIADPAPMRRFWDSKASVHEAGHINAASLRRDVDRAPIERWRSDVGEEEARRIAELCSAQLSLLGYGERTRSLR